MPAHPDEPAGVLAVRNPRRVEHTGSVASWQSYSFLYGPLAGLIVVGFLGLLLRWTSGRGTSLVERRTHPRGPEEYGMLVPVASPSNFVEGELTRRRLTDAGVRSTLAMTTAGPRLMVWPEDERTARRVLDTTAS